MNNDVDETYFTNKTWLIYGRLPSIAKKDAVATIVGRGGKVVSNVSAKLDFLVMPGPTPEPKAIRGAKAKHAALVGALVMGESDFMSLAEGEDPFDEASRPELSPLPEVLAARTYPGEDIDIDATYFTGKTWYAFGSLFLNERTGRPMPRYSQEALFSRLGARLIRDSTLADFILSEGATPLWGARLSKELQDARERGVAIFGEEDFDKLANGDRPTPPGSELEPSSNEEFGALREMIQQDGWSQERWDTYLELFDDMREDGLDHAIDYFNAYLSRKPRAERLHAWVGGDAWRQALNGHDDPRLRLARSISAGGTIAQCEAILRCSNLINIEHYAVLTGQPVAQKHWTLLAHNTTLKNLTSLRAENQRFGAAAAAQLASSEALSTLESLHIERCVFDKGAQATFFAPKSWPRLTSLGLIGNRAKEGDVASALVARGLEGVTTLSVNSDASNEASLALLTHPTLAGLRRLELQYAEQETLDILHAGPAFDGLTSLDVWWSTTRGRDMSLLRDPRLRTLETLRVDLTGNEDVLDWVLTDAEMSQSLVSLCLRARGLNWEEHLRHAQMPNLRVLRVHTRDLGALKPDEVFPSLERIEYVDSVQRWVVEYGPRNS